MEEFNVLSISMGIKFVVEIGVYDVIAKFESMVIIFAIKSLEVSYIEFGHLVHDIKILSKKDFVVLNMDVFLVCATEQHILSLQLAIANKVRDT
jgi:hypothetical protein